MSAIIIGGLFLTAVGVAEVIINRTCLLVAVYLAASLVAFIFYATDKNAARKGAWRIPEAHLHLLSLIGGWPGALVAQQKLRHKTQKPSFRFVFWITVALNIAVSIWLFTRQAIVILDSVAKQLL